MILTQVSRLEELKPTRRYLVDQIDCAPLPKINADDPDYGAETSNIPMVGTAEFIYCGNL